MNMQVTNIEIKARSTIEQHKKIRDDFLSKTHINHGKKHQIDTYFHVPKGRLKLRETDGNMQLLYYKREDKNGPKESKVSIFRSVSDRSLKKVLTDALGVWKIVDKQREVYTIGNVTLHLDVVKRLGVFIEIEAMDQDGSRGIDELTQQCRSYMEQLGIDEANLLEKSYSDMVDAEI